MKSRIKALLKNNKIFYQLYYILGSLILKTVGLFVRTDPNLILFVSYGGRKYDDSPRVVYEYLLENPVSPEHKYVWAFTNPQEHPEVESSVKIDSLPFFLTALKAGYWITNSSVSRGLDFKKKKTTNVLFEHGMVALKRIGAHALNKENVFVSKANERYDMVFLEGKHEIPILSDVWSLDEGTFITTGLPRNDDLIGFSEEDVLAAKQRLGIPADKKVILYAPTFRDFSKDGSGRSTLGIPIDFAKWEKQLGKEYVLLITAHYEVSKLLDTLPENGFVYNAFGYPRLNDLLKIADILISDYSSIVFDYSILDRPILCYGYDSDVYLAVRGSYIDIENFYCDGIIQNEDKLLNIISTMDYEKQCRFTRENIKEKYLASYGNAARKAVEIIFKNEKN